MHHTSSTSATEDAASRRPWPSGMEVRSAHSGRRARRGAGAGAGSAISYCCALRTTLMSVRRLRARPSSSALEATGLEDPRPTATKRSWGILKLSTRYFLTDSARFWESDLLADAFPRESVLPS